MPAKTFSVKEVTRRKGDHGNPKQRSRHDISAPSKNVIHYKSLQSGATPSLQTYTEQSMAAAYTNSALGEKECS
jgi:hypothetical protein